MTKFFLYAIVSIIVIWSMDSIDINQIFKKNKNYNIKANIFYFLLGISMIYLIVSFINDVFLSI